MPENAQKCKIKLMYSESGRHEIYSQMRIVED